MTSATCTHAPRPCEDRAGRQLSTSQEKSPHQKLNPQKPCSWMCSLWDGEKTNLCWFSCAGCSSLSRLIQWKLLFKLKAYGVSVVKVASSDQREECLKATFCSGAAIIYENILWKWVDELRREKKCVTVRKWRSKRAKCEDITCVDDNVT